MRNAVRVAAAAAACIGTAWLAAQSSSDPPSVEYAQPAAIENLALQILARTQLSLVSINSVKCGRATCEIGFSGTDVDPHFVGVGSNVTEELFRAQPREFRVLTSSAGTREIAPGAREHVVSFTYQPLVDLSADPRIAARQHAACAAAWRRQTENPTPDEYVRRYLASAEHYLALAAAELGGEEAERIAKRAQTDLGPLIRECRLWPQ